MMDETAHQFEPTLEHIYTLLATVNAKLDEIISWKQDMQEAVAGMQSSPIGRMLGSLIPTGSVNAHR